MIDLRTGYHWRLPTSPQAGGADLGQLIELATSGAPGAAALRAFLTDSGAPDRAERLQARNAALRRALAVLSRAPTWAACNALAAGIERFELIVWPRLQAGADVAELGPLDRELLAARLAGPLPRTGRQLWNVMHGQTAGLQSPKPGP
jgi:hypothetical protein